MMRSSINGRRRVAANAAANWLGFAVSVAVTFFMAPRLVHGLGDRAYGVWVLVESVLAYLALFDLGIGAAVVRFVARVDETQEREDVNRVFSTSLAIFACLGLVALGITLGLAFGSARPLGAPDDVANSARWMLVLLGLNLAVGLPFSVYDSVLCAVGHFPLRTIVQLGLLGLRTAVFLEILRRGGGLVEIGLAITVCGLLQYAILAIASHVAIPDLRFSFRSVDRSTFSSIRSYSLWAFVASIAGNISFSTDAIVIGAFLTPEYITYFAVAARLTEYCKTACRSATTVLTPAISALEAKGNLQEIRRILVTGSRYVVWFVLPVQLTLVCLGNSFLSLWMGREIAEASYLPLLILSMPLTLCLSQSIAGRILYGVGRLRAFAWMTLTEALANLAISLVLVHRFGIVGVAIGTAIPNLVFNAALVLYICRILDVRLDAYLRGAFLAPTVAAAAPLTTWYVGHAIFGDPRDWTSFFLAVGSGLFAFALAGCLLERDIRDRIRRLVGRVRNVETFPTRTSGASTQQDTIVASSQG